MRRFVFDKQRVNHWLWPRIGRESPFSPDGSFQVIGVEEDGELIAGVVIDSFSSNARCSIHAAGLNRKWCSRALLRMLFEYVFITANCKVVINTVAANNHDSMRITRKLGFNEACRIKDGCGDCDLVIFAMHKDNCRWLGEQHELHFKKAA